MQRAEAQVIEAIHEERARIHVIRADRISGTALFSRAEVDIDFYSVGFGGAIAVKHSMHIRGLMDFHKSVVGFAGFLINASGDRLFACVGTLDLDFHDLPF